MCTTTFFSPLRCSSFFRNRNPFYDPICTSRLTISFLLLSPEITMFFFYFPCFFMLCNTWLTHSRMYCFCLFYNSLKLRISVSVSIYRHLWWLSLSSVSFLYFSPFLFFYFFSRRFIDFFPFFFSFFFIRRSVDGVEGWRNRRCRRHNTAGASLIG